jgi:APA family basic amino acid/polyamine antiporter
VNPNPVAAPRQHLGLWSGVGIVVANMIGAGVFLSSGFMAQDMGPGAILLAWLAGAVLALAGSRAYAAIATLVPRSGGEYRYLSDLLHPSLGYLSGWASLLIGFSAAMAIDAIAAGAFAKTLVPELDHRLFGAGIVIALTILHASGLTLSRRTQNTLVAVKAALVVAFVVVGLSLGRTAWPSWTPPTHATGFPFGAFMRSLFFIAWAFSGWNAAAYVAEEFKDPKRDVPRAMLIGCGLVAVLYLLVNWVLVANITPDRAATVFAYETSRITLGHLVMQDLLGVVGAKVMSAFVLIALVSSMSAMTLTGPRVYAAMAADGFLPRFLIAREGKPPSWSVVLQAALALVLVAAQELVHVMENLGAVLTLFAALTTIALLRARFARPAAAKITLLPLACAALYSAFAMWMLYFGFQGRSRLLPWLSAIATAAVVGYAVTMRSRERRRLAAAGGEDPTLLRRA